MQKGYKFRIYPNKAQKILISKTCGCARIEGIKIINIKYRTLGTSGSQACGDSVRPLNVKAVVDSARSLSL